MAAPSQSPPEPPASPTARNRLTPHRHPAAHGWRSRTAGWRRNFIASPAAASNASASGHGQRTRPARNGAPSANRNCGSAAFATVSPRSSFPTRARLAISFAGSTALRGNRATTRPLALSSHGAASSNFPAPHIGSNRTACSAIRGTGNTSLVNLSARGTSTIALSCSRIPAPRSKNNCAFTS